MIKKISLKHEKKKGVVKPQIIYVWLEVQLKLSGDLRVLISGRGHAWHAQGPGFDSQHCKNKMKHTNKKAYLMITIGISG